MRCWPGEGVMVAATPTSNGKCWCGCGASVAPGKFFVQNHDRWAEAYVIRRRYGSIAAFLDHHGYGPEGQSARDEADRDVEEIPSSDRMTEEEEDRLDIAEAERRLADPDEVPIPYEQARKTLGLG
jgi:hypothetical protein